MSFDFQQIERQVKQWWEAEQVYRTEIDLSRPKCYVLDMFPYPSGAGLHVGHPLGYIASDVYARFKRLSGFNVLHPMGYDSFGLPAEQYAIQTGQHPAVTTEQNINMFRRQMDLLGFSYDWRREVRTSDPAFYRWTQWMFIRMFHSWYNKKTDRAEPIETLVQHFTRSGNQEVEACCGPVPRFDAAQWRSFSKVEQSDILLKYRLAYQDYVWVNWCPALGTVLANDEVRDGRSERGGYPVERRLMKQWMLRITAYADRLLHGLNQLAWPEAIKETQRNWIGRSEGCLIRFSVVDAQAQPIRDAHGNPLAVTVFTTRPDTVFGATFLVLAPELELVDLLTAPDYRHYVDAYRLRAQQRNERDRLMELRSMTGQFIGAYAVHPFSGQQLPVWVSDYVLAGVGTGAIMGVPGHDQRDHRFAQVHALPILSILQNVEVHDQAYEKPEGLLCNSAFLDGLTVAQAQAEVCRRVEQRGIGQRHITYKMHDAVFGRQRYWGEPIPIYYDEQGIAHTLPEEEIPLKLPDIDSYLPTEAGEPPLARARHWKYKGVYEYEKTTMPGWAGSSWYFLRYMDPHNDKAFVSREALRYWGNVDLYVGGDEHATGHLIYVRFWTKFLFDLGLIPFDEPVQRLVNQGKIQGRSCLVHRTEQGAFLSFGKRQQEPYRSVSTTALHIPLSLVTEDQVDVPALQSWRSDFAKATFICEDDGSFRCERVVEKMSKSKHNVVNPDRIIEQYGADCFRLYEMFLGPLEMDKPWDTKGIDGCFRFLRKVWRLFYDDQGNWWVSEAMPTEDELRALHQLIRQASTGMEQLTLNTVVSAFMICVNTLTSLSCRKRAVLEPLIICLAPLAPFLSEFLWRKLGHAQSVFYEQWPQADAQYLRSEQFTYPIAINGKTRLKLSLSLDLTEEEIKQQILAADGIQKYLQGRNPQKIIVVKGRMVNVVI